MRHLDAKDYKAVLKVSRGAFAPTNTTVEITDPEMIANLHEAFERIKKKEHGRSRSDWKPDGSLTFYDNGGGERKIILGIGEWTEGGSSEVEYPISEDLKQTIRTVATKEVERAND